METKKLFLLAAMLLMSVCSFAQNDNTPLKGDVNEDGKVDVADIAAVINIMKNGGGTTDGKLYFYVGTEKPTSLSQAVLTPRALKINMSICDKTLLSKWANYLVKVQANKLDSDLPFEEYFIDDVIKNVKAGIETMIYQGDSSNANAVEFDGLLKTLQASGNTTIVTTGASSVTSYRKR